MTDLYPVIEIRKHCVQGDFRLIIKKVNGVSALKEFALVAYRPAI